MFKPALLNNFIYSIYYPLIYVKKVGGGGYSQECILDELLTKKV